MTLRSALERFVESNIRKRGMQYFREGLVEITESGSQAVEATVTGSDQYDVRLRRDRRWLRVSCSCPYFADHETCKHVWATILAADAKQALRGPGGSLPNRLGPEIDDDWDLDDDRYDLDPVPPLPPPRQVGPPARPVLAAPRTPTWRDLLGQIEPASPPAMVQADEILYMIDGPATLKSQQLTLEILTGRRKRDGNLGKLYSLRLTRADISRLPEPADRQILALLAGAAASSPWTSYWYAANTAMVPSRSEIPDPTAPALVALLCGTGRCRLRSAPQSDEGEPLAWDGGEPWEMWLEVQETPDGGCVVSGSLRRGADRLTTKEPALVLRSGLLFHAGRAARLDARAFGWLSLLHRTGELRVPAAEKHELLERLLMTPDLPQLDLPEALRVEEVRSVPRPRLRLRAPDPHAPVHRDWPRAELSFLYDGREVGAGEPGAGLYQREERRLLLRNPDAERRAAGRLRELGLKTVDGPNGQRDLRVPQTRVGDVIHKLLAEGWSVEAEGKLYRSAGRFQMGVTSGMDWFELHGEAEFDGHTVRLPELLAALRRGDGFVPLSDGSIGLLPEAWLRRLAPMAGLGEQKDDHLRFQSAQACLLDAWLAGEPETTCDETFARARQRLQRFEGIEPAPAPPEFQGELRGYQQAGLGWLHFLREFGFGGCLADDMGLGKTVQILALLESRRAAREAEGLGPSLVVAPRSLIFNWLAEAQRFTPRLRVLDHTGIGRIGRAGGNDVEPFAGYDLVLTTYGTLRRDVASLRQVEFDYVVLDEAQAIKNGDSQSAKAARLLRGRNRLALSGTPIENHLGELWSLLEFLNPGLLGASSLLRARSTELRNPDAETRPLLARALRPFLLRRTKEQVASELPAKLEQTLFCELPPKQRRLYDELRDHYRGSLTARMGEQGLERSKILVLEALLRLRQAACHPALLDRDRKDEPSAKLDMLLPQLQEVIAEGHKALVFSQFTSFLALLREQLDREGISYLYLDGRTRDRREKVERFQSDPGFPLFLISLKAGGLGLNLTAADYVYLLDPWWNPAVEAQAIDRAHRIGQTRPVFASRLVARDTVEEKILALQAGKRELADAIIQADRSLLAGLTREDLELLLS
jgi:hypothetical protein